MFSDKRRATFVLSLFWAALVNFSWLQAPLITPQNAEQLREVAVIQQEGRRFIFGLSWSADGEQLALGIGGSIKIYSMTALNEPEVLEPDFTVSDVVFSPTEAKLAYVDDGGQIHIYDLATKSQISANQDAIRLAYSPDGNLLASAWSGSIYLWNTSDLSLVGQVENGEDNDVVVLVFSPDGSQLVTRNVRSGPYIWDVNTILQSKQPLSYDQATDLNQPPGTGIIFNPADGRLLLSVNGFIGDLALSEAEAAVQINSEIEPVATPINRGTPASLLMTISPDGSLLATGDQAGQVVVIDLATGTRIATFQAHSERIGALLFNPTGTLLATGSNEGIVRLWGIAE